jgi:hypothetical protein
MPAGQASGVGSVEVGRVLAPSGHHFRQTGTGGLPPDVDHHGGGLVRRPDATDAVWKDLGLRRHDETDVEVPGVISVVGQGHEPPALHSGHHAVANLAALDQRGAISLSASRSSSMIPSSLGRSGGFGDGLRFQIMAGP